MTTEGAPEEQPDVISGYCYVQLLKTLDPAVYEGLSNIALTAHSAYHVHKSYHKTSIIIII